MRVITLCFSLVSLLVLPAVCSAEKYTVLLQEKQFVYQDKSIEDLDIKKGDSITFKNAEKTEYNIASKSAAKPFKLGVMNQGDAKSVVFDKVGEVEVECSINTEMYLKINVR